MHSSDSEMSSLIRKAIGRAHVAFPGIPLAWLQQGCPDGTLVSLGFRIQNSAQLDDLGFSSVEL